MMVGGKIERLSCEGWIHISIALSTPTMARGTRDKQLLHFLTSQNHMEASHPLMSASKGQMQAKTQGGNSAMLSKNPGTRHEE